MTGNKTNTFAMTITFGLLVGTGVGLGIGFLTHDIALWLAIGVGSGLTFAASIGLAVSSS